MQRDNNGGLVLLRNLLIALLLSVMLVVCIIGGGLYLWARQEGLNPIKAIQLRINLALKDDELNKPAGSNPNTIAFEVSFGDSAAAVASNLEGSGLISDAGLFLDYVEYHRLDSQLEAGTYYLSQTQTIPQIAMALTDASAATIPFRTGEGWRMEEVAAVIDANPRLNFSGADFLAVVGPGAPIPPDFKQRVGMPDQLKNGRQPSLEGSVPGNVPA